jgi:hypothetical protein
MKAENPLSRRLTTPGTKKVMAGIHLTSEVPLGFQMLPMLKLPAVFMKSMSILLYLLTRRIPYA